jgi:hypothetical protein
MNNNLPVNQIISSIEPWTNIEDIYQTMTVRQDLLATVVLEWK